MLKPICSILLLLFSSFEVSAVCIQNFDKKICANFQIMPSVIVKTSLSKEELSKRLSKEFVGKINKKSYKNIKQLAYLGDSNLFLVANDKAQDTAKKLAKMDFIFYAQPNILQNRHHQKYPSVKQQDITERYQLKKKWQKTKGNGVKIAIIDDGFNLNHEDLKDVKVAFEYDVEQGKLDSSPKIRLDKHGTQVAGIIFAQHNKIGINGIAPEAELIAIRQTSNITSQTILALTVANLAGADVINCSWKSPILLQPVYDVLVHLAKFGREGKGTAIVFSAGNDAHQIKPYETEAAVAEMVVVGTTQAYSNFGKSVDFVIPSGLKTTRKNGYSIFGGTSATAPVISGLLALKIAEHKEDSITEIIQRLKDELNERK